MSSKEILKESIARRLAEEGSPTWTAFQRFEWLIGELDEYIDRWLGFCALPHTSMSALTEGNLFLTIQVATELAESELSHSNFGAAVVERWREYENALRRISTSKTKDDAEPLRKALSEVRAEL